MTRRELFPAALAPLAAGLVPAFGQTVASDEGFKPHPADELLINTMLGSKIDLKTMKGKVCAVELLLTWCSHCQASAKVLQGLWTELKPKGFEVLGAATNTDAAKAKTDIGSFLGATNAQFPVGWITQEQTYKFLQHPVGKNLFFPQLVLVDRRGQVVYQHTGEVDEVALRAEIMKYLAPGGGAAAPAAKTPLKPGTAAKKS